MRTLVYFACTALLLGCSGERIEQPGDGFGAGASQSGGAAAGSSSGSGGSAAGSGATSSGTGGTADASGGSGGTGNAGGASAGSTSVAGAVQEPDSRAAERAAIGEELSALAGLDAATLRERYPVAFEPAPSYDTSTIAGLDLIQASSLALTDAELAALAAKGFA
ncbi:MAG TPA: hypothetical protein VGK73_21300, partial [Polyangiaceae bacterium]